MEADALRNLPSVDSLANSNILQGRSAKLRVYLARKAVEDARRQILADSPRPIEELLAESLAAAEAPVLGKVVNASGVILHTGLGRARLAPSATEAVRFATEGHTFLEFDQDTGNRGDRQLIVRDLLCYLTGAEDALVVNNCASAVILSLAALSEGKEVILSRGQMVEIGGSFRMPEIVVQSGCRLREVGCTNKVRLRDYEEAIGESTGVVLRCHPSNFKIVGFTEEPSVKDLAALCTRSGLPLVDDAGSGALVDTSSFGLPREPQLGESLREGADLVTASGDKMLGGPQAGLIIGHKDVIARVKRHPIARAVRVDKMTLAALGATLRLYRDGREVEIPTIRYLARSLEEVRLMAEALAASRAGSVVDAGETEVGGGSLPGSGVPSYRCGLTASSCVELSKALRKAGVVGRIERDMVWLDPRTMEADEVQYVCAILEQLP